MRELVFANVNDGDQMPGDPHTWDGAVQCFSIMCPSLTRAEAEAAAAEARRRMIPTATHTMRSLIIEMFQR